jgi:hypothetical protein
MANDGVQPWKQDQKAQRDHQRVPPEWTCESPLSCSCSYLLVLFLFRPCGWNGLREWFPGVEVLAWDRAEEVVSASRTFQYPGPVIPYLTCSSNCLPVCARRVVASESGGACSYPSRNFGARGTDKVARLIDLQP